ncbi:zinc-ribbon domain-containing protein [Haladaptatus sp. DYF46]
MSLPAVVRQWLADENGLIYECRNCGTTLDPSDQICPVCGSSQIVEFDVS